MSAPRLAWQLQQQQQQTDLDLTFGESRTSLCFLPRRHYWYDAKRLYHDAPLLLHGSILHWTVRCYATAGSCDGAAAGGGGHRRMFVADRIGRNPTALMWKLNVAVENDSKAIYQMTLVCLPRY